MKPESHTFNRIIVGLKRLSFFTSTSKFCDFGFVIVAGFHHFSLSPLIMDPAATTSQGWNVVCRDTTLRRSGGFLPSPKCVLRDTDRRLNHTAKVAFIWLLSYAFDFMEKKLPRRNAEGFAIEFDTVAELTVDLGLSPKCDHTARRALKALKARGLIDVKRTGAGRPNRYEILELRNIYPDDPDWPKMDNQDLQPPPDIPIVRIQEITKTSTIDLPSLANQPFMANQDWAKLRELLKNPEMANSNGQALEQEILNAHVQGENEKINSNGRSAGQLNLDGLPPGVAARLGEISEEIISCKDDKRRNALEMLYIMLETFHDLQSEDFYMKIGLNMTRAEIASGFEYVRNREARGMIKKSRAKAFTTEMKRLAKESGVRITRW